MAPSILREVRAPGTVIFLSGKSGVYPGEKLMCIAAVSDTKKERVHQFFYLVLPTSCHNPGSGPPRGVFVSWFLNCSSISPIYAIILPWHRLFNED